MTTKANHQKARDTPTLTSVRHLATIPVWSTTQISAASVLGISRSLAYGMAKRGELPAIRLGTRVVVAVPALLRMLGDESAGPGAA